MVFRNGVFLTCLPTYVPVVMLRHFEVVEDRRLEFFQIRCVDSQPGIAGGNDVGEVFDGYVSVVENGRSEFLARGSKLPVAASGRTSTRCQP